MNLSSPLGVSPALGLYAKHGDALDELWCDRDDPSHEALAAEIGEELAKVKREHDEELAEVYDAAEADFNRMMMAVRAGLERCFITCDSPVLASFRISSEWRAGAWLDDRAAPPGRNRLYLGLSVESGKEDTFAWVWLWAKGGRRSQGLILAGLEESPPRRAATYEVHEDSVALLRAPLSDFCTAGRTAVDMDALVERVANVVEAISGDQWRAVFRNLAVRSGQPAPAKQR